MNSILSRIGATAAVALAASAHAAVNYWDFNVFSRSTIGTANQPYGSDYQGASGAVGNAFFNGFTVRGVSGTSPSLTEGFYGGANFSLGGSVNNGGIETAGTVTLTSASVAGNIFAGGNLAGTRGTVMGNVRLGGIKTASNQLTINGTLTQNSTFTPTVNLNDVSSYFAGVGSYAAGLSPTTSYTNNFGELIVNASGPLTVVNFNTSDFINAYGIRIVGSGSVICNVPGSSLTFASKTWTYTNGASNANTLLNLNQAQTLNLSGGNTVNILAANAATNFSSGLVTGNLIVGSLTGSGQVNWSQLGGFGGGSVVPAPGVLALTGAGAIAVIRRRRQA